MKTDGTITRWIRLVLAAAMALAVGLAITPTGTQAALDYDPNATGGTAGPGELTRFQIDGDAAHGSPGSDGTVHPPGVTEDWTNPPYGPQPIGSDPALPAPQGLGSTGLIPLTFDQIQADDYPLVTPSPNPAAGLPGEPQFCDGNKEDGWVGGEKVQVVSIDNPLFNVNGQQALECSSVLDKGNLFSVYTAYEIVTIPNVYGDPNSGSQNHTILYGAWERGEVPGELNFYIPIADAVPGNSSGDRLISFDYDSSAPLAFRVLSWNGTGWVIDSSGSVAGNPAVFAASVGFVDGSPFGSNNRPSFGEFAIDLTATDILPDAASGECVELSTAGFVFTETGNSANAQLKDYVGAPKVPIGNCGDLEIVKEGPAGLSTSPDFDFRVEQQDSSAIFSSAPTTTPPSTDTQYNDQFQIGDTVSLTDIFAEPDYLAFENPVAMPGTTAPAPLPTGWEMVEITCTYIDQFTPGFPVVTETMYTLDDGRLVDGNGDLRVAQVQSNAFLTAIGAGGFTPSCTITNDAAGIVLVKDGTGDPTQSFDFDANGGAVSLVLGGSTFLPFDADTVVTISEADVVGADPGWSLDAIACENEDGSPTGTPDLAGRSVTVTSDDTTNTITCTFTNNQNGRIIVEKVADPATDVFTFDVTGPVTDTLGPIGNGGSDDTGDVPAGEYTVTEVLPAADPEWVLTGVDCGDGAEDISGGPSVNVSLDAGEIVTCVFTNQQQGAIVIDKQVVEPGTSTVVADGSQDATFTFDGDVAGTIETTDGVTADGNELESNPVMPGDFTVTETTSATPGYTLEDVVCDDADSVRNGAGADIVVGSGETVRCTFSNSRNQATFTLQKSWGDGTLDGEVVNLGATVAGPDPIAGSIAATATSPNGAAGTNTVTVYSGQTVSFSETFQTPGAGDGYITSLDCGDVGTMTLTPAGDSRGGSLDVGDTPSDVTCTFTNTPKVAGVALQKAWADNSRVGDSAVLTLSTDPTGASDVATSNAPDDAVFNGPTATDDNTAFVGVVAGDTVTFGEDLGAATGNYTTAFECVGATNTPTKISDDVYTLLIATADVDNDATIFCTFTNTRIEVPLVLEKDWDDAKTGDSVTLSATGSDTTPIEYVSVADSADDTDTSDPFTVYAGETVTLAEVFGAGQGAAYDQSLSCTGATDTDLTDDELTISPLDPLAGANVITCTWVNARRSVDVVVAKSLSPIGSGSFDLSINDVVVVDGAGDGDSNDTTPVSVFVGDSVAVSEAADAGAPSLANFASSLACDSGIVVDPNGGVSGGFDVPRDLATGTTITCTFTNVRNEAQLIVTKSWADSPANGDAVALSSDGGLAGPAVGANSNNGDDGDDADVTSTVYGGETISVAEVFGPGDSANYATTLLCSDAAGNLVDTADSLTGEFTVPADPTAITCTFTNTRLRTELTLRKQWILGATGDTADLTVVGEAGTGTALSTATFGQAFDPSDGAETTITVYAGETVDLDEVVTPGENYDSTLVCTLPENDPTGADRSFDLAISPLDVDPITCTFVNTRKEVDIELVKSWGGSPANGDTVALTIDGTRAATAGSDSNDGDDANDSSATITGLAGETVTLAEAFGPGLAENYTTSLECSDGASTLTYTDGALTGDLAVDAADEDLPIICTFTNVRKSTDLVLQKTWVDAVAGDTADLTATGQDGALVTDTDTQTATAPAGSGTSATTAAITVYAGQAVTLAEAFGPNTATYDATAFACTSGDQSPAWQDGELAAALNVSAADVDAANTAGEPITCTFTNTAQRGTIVIVKSIDGVNDGTFDFEGDWSADGVTSNPADTDPVDFSITTDALTGAVTFADVLVGSYTVSETDSGANFDGTTVTCVEAGGDDGSGPDGGTDLPLTGSIDLDNGETVTCTFTNTERSTIVIVKDAQPDAAQNFSFTTTEPATFDLLDDAFDLDDDADGTLSNTYTSVLVPGGETYSVTELDTPGWTLDPSSSCTAGGAFDGATATITPAPGTTVTCTFVNTANPAGISATKAVEGQVGPWGPFEFTLAGGTFTGDATQAVDSGDATANWSDLVEGQQYTLTEAQVPGYQAGAEFTCVVLVPAGADFVALPDADDATDGFQFTAVAGAIYDCDITNVAVPGSVDVTKSVTGVADDLAWAFEFTIDPDAPPANPQSVDGVGNSTSAPATWTDLVPGVTYTVTETSVPGWTAGPIECTVTPADPAGAPVVTTDGSFTVTPGASVSCDFDNAANPGSVDVTKSVTGVADDLAWSFEFTIDPDAPPANPQSVDGVGNSTSAPATWTDLVPGVTYTVTETSVPGWTAGPIECTVTPADPAGAPVVTTDGSFTVTPGASVSCDFDNAANPGSVDVTKSVTGVADDFAWAFEFAIDPLPAGETNPKTASGVGNVTSDPVSWAGLVPGVTYTVTETSVPGWTAGPIECTVTPADPDADPVVTTDGSFTVTPGASVSCDFDNAANPGSVDVTKSVTGVADDFAWAFDFAIDPLPAGETNPKTASGVGNVTSSAVSWTDLVPGVTYTVTETVPAGWTQGPIECTVTAADGAVLGLTVGSFTVQPGDSVSCDFDNAADPGSVDVTKSVTGVADDFAWAFDFAIDPLPAGETNPKTASGVGNVTSDPVSWAGLVPGVTYTVTETVPAGWTQGPIECTVTPADPDADPVVTTDGSFTVTPGASVSCDFDNAANPGSVDVTKSVTGVADDFAWAFEFAIDPLPAGETNPKTASGVGNVTSDPVSWAGLVPGVTYTVTETVPAGWTQGPIECTVTPADPDAAPVVTTDGSFTVTPGASVSCDFDNAANPGDVDVTKTVIGVDADLAWAFDFAIDPLPAGETNPKTASGVGNVTSDPVSWAGLVPGVTYTVTETVPAGWTQGPIECTVTPADPDADPVVTTDGSFTVTPGASVSCDFDNSVNPSEVSVTKLVDGGLDAAQGWEFEFTLTPDANPVGSLTASGTGDGSDTVTWTNLVPGTEYVVAEVLPGGNTTTYANGVLSCTGAADTDDDDQTVTFTAPVGGAGVEVECTVTNTALSDVSFDKVVDSVTRDADSGVWTITYLIDVVNADDAGAGVYDLSDEFRFGAGVTIVDGSASVINTDPGTITTNAAFDGVGDTSVVTAESIASATTHTYLVSVDVTIAVGPDTDGDCIGEPGAGTGFLNTAQIAVDGGEPLTTEACAGFAQLTLVKNLINDDGGNGTIADFPLTAEGPASLSGVSGSDGVSSAVPAGSYALAEDELVEGYTNAGFVCEGATDSSSSSVLLADGDNATCTIVNDDEPIDLELTKDDGGAEAVAGGAPFDYTISVRNIGTRDLDLDEPVTVTDELPAGLSWVSFPANCSQAGQTLTCDVDPALLPAGGELVVITATVEADADAASGIYVNKASVTTEDDTTTNPPCPALADNNVDCEETPVDRNGGVQIVKTDDVADGASVQPGDTFTYELVVTNTGVSTLLPGTHVEDDLPAQLDFVSAVGGAGWTCNDTSPIDCDYAPELQPGASAPAIIVTVSVAEDASGENIENVAIVRAAVDRDCPTATDRLVESFAPACNEVTDDDDETTPLSANADLAIVKTASVDEVGAGGGFDWILDITNNGPGTAVNVVIGDLVPTAVVVTSVSSDDFDCGNDGNTVSCTVASLAVGESGTVTIAVSVPLTAPDAEVVNVGTVESDTPDPDLSNNSDEASVTLVGIAPPTTTLPPVTLPPTGSNGTDPLTRAGIVFLLLGGGFILITRRRREDVTTG